MTSIKTFKQENQRSILYKKLETKFFYDPHQETTTTEQQVPDLGQVQTNATSLNIYQVQTFTVTWNYIVTSQPRKTRYKMA